MNYLPLTPQDRREMLAEIGAKNIEEILSVIPSKLRTPTLKLPEALSEVRAQSFFETCARKNLNAKDALSFLGAGAYEHFIPSVVPFITSRSEFMTAYTPYQAEASQGTLQALFEYQSLICELTGMDVSNGSHYDGATALAEAVLMSLAKTGRRKVLCANSLHPHYREVLTTYLAPAHIEFQEIPFLQDGALSRSTIEKMLDQETASLIIQSPNFFGLVEDLHGVSELTHRAGALFILTAHPLSFGFYKTPTEWGVDIACGEGQPLGIPMSFGGPWLGYMASTKALMRQIPGRFSGITNDAEGRRAFCLTLQAREQHIRRERASSNICTNQALCAIAAAVYLTALGPEGIKRVAELNMENAYYLRAQLEKIPEFKLMTCGPIFNEFAIKCPKPVREINQFLLTRGIIGGLDLSEYYPKLSGAMLICTTETKTKAELDRFASLLREAAL